MAVRTPSRKIVDVGTLPGAIGEPMFMLTEDFGKIRRRLPAPVLSDGTLRFAAIVAAFFQASMPAIITLEEIENGYTRVVFGHSWSCCAVNRNDPRHRYSQLLIHPRLSSGSTNPSTGRRSCAAVTSHRRVDDPSTFRSASLRRGDREKRRWLIFSLKAGWKWRCESVGDSGRSNVQRSHPDTSGASSHGGRRRPSARVQILGNPRVQGHVQARQAIRNRLTSRYRWYDLWLFFPDADCANDDAMRRLETELETQRIFVALLRRAAGGGNLRVRCIPRRPTEHERTWAESRMNPRFKEEIFGPLLKKRGNPDLADEGRARMTAQSLKTFRSCMDCVPN